MKVFYSEAHRHRDARTELHGGQLVAPFEAPFRAEWILSACKQAGHGPVVTPDSHDLSIALKVHDADYVGFLEDAWERWAELGFEGEAIPTCFPTRRLQQERPPRDIEGQLGYYAFAAETAITEGTWKAAQAAMDTALSAAKSVSEDGLHAFALCRPPGHHASIDQFGGYCFLNNAAIAAQFLLEAGATRVALLDVDFHHGNGTQDIFYRRGDVFFASIHGDPLDAFPHFLGFADERGQGEGINRNLNYPLPPGTNYATWAKAMDHALQKFSEFGAEALVVSLGVDAYEKDPISFFKLTTEDFTRYGERLGKARLPTVFCMEGGYGVQEIGQNVANVLSGFETASG